jgi:tetratricopeptide (TPR) repeat protein
MESVTPPSAGIYDFLGWVEANKKRLVMGAGVLVAVALIVGFVLWQRGQRVVEAEYALSSVPMPFSPSEPLRPGTGDALVKIADEYSGTPTAAKATLRAGTAYFGENNLAKAQEQFDKLLRDYGDTPWVPQAFFGIAATLEAQGKTSDAIAKYKDFTEKYPNDAAVDHAKLNLARLYERTQQPALALDVLKKMTENQAAGFGPGTQEAQQRMRELFAKHPELLPPPPVTPTFNNVFSNLPPVRSTNAISITNLMSRTNVPAATGAAPAIRINPGGQ